MNIRKVIFIFTIAYAAFLSIILIGSGFLCKSSAKDKINDFIGYRTKLSKKNQDTWKEANIYGGNMIIISGILYFIANLFLTLLFYKKLQGLIFLYSCILLVLILFAGIFICEKHLKTIFDADGNRK